jgi:hypothetical protein
MEGKRYRQRDVTKLTVIFSILRMGLRTEKEKTVGTIIFKESTQFFPLPNLQVPTDYDHCLQHAGASITRGSSPVKDIDYLASLACFPSVSADKY